MKLPHLPPLIFAKNIIKKDEQKAIVYCEFPHIPSIGMYIEAAAQASSAFNTEKTQEIGFVTVVKDVKLLKQSSQLSFHIEIIKSAEISNIKQFLFNVFELQSTIPIATGNFTIYLENGAMT